LSRPNFGQTKKNPPLQWGQMGSLRTVFAEGRPAERPGSKPMLSCWPTRISDASVVGESWNNTNLVGGCHGEENKIARRRVGRGAGGRGRGERGRDATDDRAAGRLLGASGRPAQG